MFFSFKKIKDKIENKMQEKANKKEIEEDYNFIHEHYIKAISQDNDFSSLFSYQQFSKSYILKFSKDMTLKEIVFSPEEIKNKNIITSTSTSNKSRTNQDNDRDLYRDHLWGDVSASAALGLKTIEQQYKEYIDNGYSPKY